MSTIVLTFNLPTARTDGTALALTEIASFTVTPAATGGTVSPPSTVAGPFTAVAQTFTDNAPDFGQTESYSVVVTDVEGNVSAAATGSVVVPPSVLAAPNAPDSLTVTFNA